MNPSACASTVLRFALTLSCVLCAAAPTADADDDSLAARSAFLESHCQACHEGDEAEAGLDLSNLGVDLADSVTEKRWVRIVDRVRAGEMPPKDFEPPPASEKDAFLHSTGEWLKSSQLDRHRKLGRVQARRLTRKQVERSLHQLLGIDIPLADRLPEESRNGMFTTLADGQAMSHFQLQRHLAVVDLALDEAFRRALTPEDNYERDLSARQVARRNPRRRCREPEMRQGQAVVWSGTTTFYGRIPATTAPADGWYRFRLTVSALKPPQNGGVWSTVRSGLCVSSAPLLIPVTSFEATPEPRTIEFETWLPRRHMLEIRPADVTLKRARFAGGQVGTGEGEGQNVPGIAIDRLVMTRIHRAADDDVRQRLFGDLPVKPSSPRTMTVVSNAPAKDLQSRMLAFARHAFRRPVTQNDIQAYLDRALAMLEQDDHFLDALRAGYRSLLCSPRFLYFTESPGRLDDHAIAARLSYFLTGGPPDHRLSELADAGGLQEQEAIRAEAERLIDAHQEQFIQDFAAEWLELDQINFTTPDRKLFREFDPIVQLGMLDETHAYLNQMLSEDLSVTRLIDSDYTFLNSRLARYYDIEGVEGDQLQRVTLPEESRRGGLITHGAILKITANGSNTSPVVRGVWVSERLLGQSIPPPPDNVPAIEPDIRGATTIREQLAKHRSQDSCASCHVKIDPAGFALENFDPAGQWRDRYLQLSRGRRTRGPVIDASHTLPDGRSFSGVRRFRRLISERPRILAANVAEKMLVYGTGAPISFADREMVETIVDNAAEQNYGFRSILVQVATNPVFLSK